MFKARYLLGLGLSVAGVVSTASAHVCDNGVQIFRLANRDDDAAAVRQIAGPLSPMLVVEPPVAKIGRGMVRRAEIRPVEVEGSPSDLARLSPGYTVSLRLTRKAGDEIRSRLSGYSAPMLVKVCSGEIYGVENHAHRVLKHLSLGEVDSVENARLLAQSYTDSIDEKASQVVIGSTSVGTVRLGDSLGDLVEKLDACSLVLSLTPSLREFAGVPLVSADCGTALKIYARLDASGHIADMTISAGQAQTVEGIRIGTTTAELTRRLGVLRVNVFNDLVFLTAASNGGIAYGLGAEDSAHYVDNETGGSSAGAQGRIKSIWLFGEFQFTDRSSKTH